MPTPVKDLVGLYESRSPTSSSLPAPSPARFLRHSARRESAPIPQTVVPQETRNPFEDNVVDEGSSRRLSLPASSRTVTGAATRNDEIESRSGPAYSSMGARAPKQTNRRHSMDIRTQSLIRSDSPSTASSEKELRLHNEFTNVHEPLAFPSRTVPSSSPTISTGSRNDLRHKLSKSPYSPASSHDFHDNDTASSVTAAFSLPLFPLKKASISTYIPLNDLSNEPLSKAKDESPSSRLLPLHNKHKPIPAKDVFSDHAVPLYLPHLDELLSQITPPRFDTDALVIPPSKGRQKGKTKVGETTHHGIFPPLQKLDGKTLDELQHNSSVPSFFTDRNSILNSIITSVIGVTGSSAIANYYSLQGLYDGVQIFALILSSVVPKSSLSLEDKWKKLFLSTIPNVLALNIPTKLTQSLIFLAIFMVISGILLYRFYVGTSLYSPSAFREGLQSRRPPSSWGIIAVSFTLTVLYLPLSTIAMHGLLWSSDFWVVANPYTNSTVAPQDLEPLGPSDQWRDPLDFCFTTTMRKDEVNYAPIIVAMSAITFIFMTLWFPIRLMQTIRQSLPRVDPYTELGAKRTKPEMELEYQRLLERDQSPFGFLYKDFRRSWGTYKSVYLWAKLSALLVVAILSPDNCAFRSFNRGVIDTIRQSVLTASMLIWFLVQCFLVPFVDPVSNASEWISRLNYLFTSVIGLWASLDPPASSALNGPVLYVVYVITYGLDFYFAFIGISFMRRIVKKLTRRIDFSIDIFSPKLDLSASSPHLRRRIWQESIGTLILTEQACRIPAKQSIEYSEPENFEWPPYLLDFHGTPGERHVENLKILREEGLKKYARAIAMISGPDAKLFNLLRHRIQTHYIGPDCYWRPFETEENPGNRKSFFGNAWWVPFPPTLVICYDVGGHAVLDTIHEFEHYLAQNEDPHVRRRRELRVALRALDRQIVVWPYTHVEMVGSRRWFTGPRYAMQSVTHFQSCVFSIKHRGIQYWRDLTLGSGFDIEMIYTKKIQLDADAIGLDDEMDMTPTLAKFLYLNRHLVQERLEIVQEGLEEYRAHCRHEAELKQKTLSYEFLTQVYNWPLQHLEVIKAVEKSESDLRVRNLFAASQDSLDLATQRMQVTGRSEITVWWYLFWDDFWRRNHDTIGGLQQYEDDFNPHYASSIAYRPLPRAAMEAFLIQRGMLSPKGRLKKAIHHGFLNKFYFRLNQIAFHNTDNAVLVHVGDTPGEVDLNDVDLTTHVRSSSLGTGGGTDLDDAEIRTRPAFKWEDVFEDPVHRGSGKYWKYLDWQRWKDIFAVWFGLTPLDHRKLRSNGIALDVVLDDSGRYIVLERKRNSHTA